ncbi:hypothetical protein NY486_23320, partial [Enterobacter hormaechei]|nr:hypothetical protein [Enterobacter hormaechei]
DFRPTNIKHSSCSGRSETASPAQEKTKSSHSGLRCLFLDGIHRLVRLIIDRLGIVSRIIIGHAALEVLDTLGNVAHQFGNLAATKNQKHDRQYDQPVPD